MSLDNWRVSPLLHHLDRTQRSMDGPSPQVRTPHRIWRLLLLALTLSLTLGPSVGLARDHYILLFDASGSIKDDYAAWNNFWQGQAEDEEAMAQRLHGLVKKALNQPPPPFHSPAPTDYLSFFLFSLEWESPSYDPERMLISNDQLLLSEGLPPASAFTHFDYSSRGKRTRQRLAKAFRGHSPIVAATTSALPYLAQTTEQRPELAGKRVENTYLIRISDAAYNAEGNANDEYRIIFQNYRQNVTDQTASAERDFEQSFIRYRKLAREVAGAFDIGARAADCYLKTSGISQPLARPFDCAGSADAAFAKVRERGEGFLITYLEVAPLAPDIATLVGSDRSAIGLERIARAGEVSYVGTNRIFAARAELGGGGTLAPIKAFYQLDEGDFEACRLGDEGAVHCFPDDQLRFSREAIPSTIHYLFDYEQRPNRETSPFIVDLPLQRQISVEISAAEEASEAMEYVEVPRSSSILAAMFNPQRLLRDSAPEPDVQPLTDEILERFANSPEYADLAELTPIRLSRDTREAFTDYLIAESNHETIARAIWIFLLVAAAAALFLRPYWRLKLAQENFAAERGGVMLDFNRRQHEQIAVVGEVMIQNRARTIMHGPYWIAAEIKADLRHDDPDAPADPLTYRDGTRHPVAIGTPEQSALPEGTQVVDGKSYPIFFDIGQVTDCNLAPTADQRSADLITQVRVRRSRGRLARLLGSAPPAVQESVEFELPLILVAERAVVSCVPHGIVVEDQHKVVKQAYRAGERALEVCSYQLSNTSRYRYSLAVSGRLRLRASRTELNDNRPLKGVVQLQDEGGNRGEELSYHLTHGEGQRIAVIVDFTRLDNPLDQDSYHIELSREIDGEWHNEGQWFLIIQRASDRTAVAMSVIDRDRHDLPSVTEERPSLGRAITMGNREDPLPLRASSSVSGESRAPLFDLRLSNSCRNGVGRALWHCRIEVESEEHLHLPPRSLLLSDHRGEILRDDHTGRLLDSPDETERNEILAVELRVDRLRIDRRDMRIALKIITEWEILPEGDRDPSDVRTVTTELQVACVLRYFPPLRVLGIDIGTSAVAVAFASGPRAIEPLQLHRRLTQIEAEDNSQHRYDDPAGNTPFLSSECNVFIDTPQKKLKELRPSDPEFLTLPMIEDAVRSVPDKVFVSLKALLSSGYAHLPLPASKYPYAGPNGIEEKASPPIDEVFAGLYEGLLKHYIHPLLEAMQRGGFSYALITHPNTYTPNHVAKLRAVVETILVGSGGSGADRVYPENIEFLSESDAVAFYYLLHAKKLNNDDWDRIPEIEHILVYDIGAGTLDLTHLEVTWREDEVDSTHPDRSKTPIEITIKKRIGVNRAGNMLDECIARDLHEDLATRLTEGQYIGPIVVDSALPMSPEQRHSMDELRQEIRKLKVAVANAVKNDDPSPLRLPLTLGRASSLVQTSGRDTADLYEGIERIQVEGAAVYWTPTAEEVLNGAYVQAFLQRVTDEELRRFFGDSIPTLDTVIVSGRTSLWPGLMDRLKQTLGDPPRPHWVDFGRDPTELKNVVVLGAMERQFHWEDLRPKDPGLIGDFCVEYEPVVRNWTRKRYTYSGQSERFDFTNASEVYIGIDTSNDFHVCFSFLPSQYYARDKQLEIALEFDERGSLTATLKNSDGRTDTLRGVSDIPTLSYAGTPWPLGQSKLTHKTPDEVVS